MGNEHSKRPAADMLVAPQPTQPEPGKQTLPQGISPFVTRDNAAPLNGQLLTQHQRDLQTMEYIANVNAAQAAFYTALAQVWSENLVKKDESPSILITFVIEAITAQMTAGLGAAYKFFTRAKPQDVLSILRGEDAPNPGLVVSALRSIGEGPATLAIRSATNTAKRTALAGLKAESSDGRANEGFLAELGDRAALTFQHQRTDPLNLPVSDADLILLTRSYAAENGHTISGYKTAIEERTRRFRRSEASHIGRERRADLGHARDSKVVWIKRDGRLRLHYSTLDHAGLGTANIPTSVDMRDETKVHPSQTRTADFQIGPPVERELEETALARHIQAWGQPPETIETTERTPDAPRDVGDLNQFVPQNNEDFQRIP